MKGFWDDGVIVKGFENASTHAHTKIDGYSQYGYLLTRFCSKAFSSQHQINNNETEKSQDSENSIASCIHDLESATS